MLFEWICVGVLMWGSSSPSWEGRRGFLAESIERKHWSILSLCLCYDKDRTLPKPIHFFFSSSSLLIWKAFSSIFLQCEWFSSPVWFPGSSLQAFSGPGLPLRVVCIPPPNFHSGTAWGRPGSPSSSPVIYSSLGQDMEGSWSSDGFVGRVPWESLLIWAPQVVL